MRILSEDHRARVPGAHARPPASESHLRRTREIREPLGPSLGHRVKKGRRPRVPGPPTASRIAPSRALNISDSPAFKTKRNHVAGTWSFRA